jgi:hypothetical protein
MNGKKFPSLLPVGLAFLVCTVALVGSINPAAVGQQQNNTGGNQNMTTSTTSTTNNTATSTASTLDCQTAASTLGGMVIPNPTGVCDVAVPRQGLQVQDSSTGATLNNLLVINPLFEFAQVQNQATTGAVNQAMVYGFGEFALMDGELSSAIKLLSNTSWNIVAVHNHVIGESPSMIFVHAIANGDINTLVRDARVVLDSLMTQAQTSTTAGGGAGNATTAGNGTTGGNMTNNSSPSGVTGGTTTGEGATAGDGVGTFGGGGGTSPGPGVGTTEGGQQGGGTTGSGEGNASGGVSGTLGGAAGPQVRP